jgi:hypothetical protein
MNSENEWVVSTLEDFSGAIPSNYYFFVLGSTALLSYTEAVGYSRPIRDIDAIGVQDGIQGIIVNLVAQGYRQDTFIDPQFPMANSLRKHGKSRYLRFEKENRALELMATNLQFSNGSIDVELYPELTISLPEQAVQTTRFNGRSFQALSPEALFCLYNVGLKTWGKLVKTRIDQRKQDLEAISKVMNKEKLAEIAYQAFLRIGPLKFKIPSRLIMNR